MDFFEEVGTFFRAGLLPHEILWQNLGRSVIIFWRLMEPETRRLRVETSNPHLGSESEYLAGEMLAYNARKGAPDPCPDEPTLRREIERHRERVMQRLALVDLTNEPALEEGR